MREGVSWFFRILEIAVISVVVAVTGWVWNAEGRVKDLEAHTSVINSRAASLEATTGAIQMQGTDIKLIQLDLAYMKERMDEMKVILERTR